MQRFGVTVIALAMVIACWAESALAIPHFQKEFLVLYVGEDKDTELATLPNKDKCFICHQGKLRKNHNSYGIHLVDLLDKKKHMKDPEAIVAALKKVEALHSVPDDESSPTYKEILESGKLPGPSIEEAKKEPEELEKKPEA